MKLRPIFKWAGGKYRMIDRIFSYFPKEYNDFYEPFGGSGAMSLFLYENSNSKIYLSDINCDIFEFYKILKNETEYVINGIKKLEYIFNNEFDQVDYYNKVRENFNSKNYPHLFYFLNKTSFNGLTRYNSSGNFNVPFGKRNFNPDIDNLIEFSKFLNSERIDLKCQSFDKINPKTEDLVYLDPPYHPLNETGFTSYNLEGWSEKDEINLSNICKDWNRNGIKFILSNNDLPVVKELFPYNMATIDSIRSVGASKETRKENTGDIDMELVHGFKERLNMGEKYEEKICEYFSINFDIEKVDIATQKIGIDRIFISKKTGKKSSVEFKTDDRSKTTGNFFIETISQEVNGEIIKDGWALTCKADILIIFTPYDGNLFIVKPKDIKNMVEIWSNKYKICRAKNSSYYTVGVCVPIKFFEKDVNHTKLNLNARLIPTKT